MSRGFTKATPQIVKRSIANKLIRIGDKLRDLNTRFGVRRYNVRILRTVSDGEQRGAGVETVLSELLLLPTPKISDMSGLRAVLNLSGLDEVGDIQLSEVSARFTEDQLRGYGEDGAPPAKNENVYYEIEFVRTDGRDSDRRRFVVATAPNNVPDNVEWVISLKRARGDRLRDGSVR